MEAEGDLQSLIVHRASLLLGLQITEPDLQLQPAELLQEHQTKLTLILSNPGAPRKATCETLILMPMIFSFTTDHTPNDLSPINYKLKSAIFI